MEEKESIINEKSSEDIVEDEKQCPPISKELLDHLKDTFDVRKMLSYSVELEYLKGIQSVLNYLEFNYKDN